MLSVVISKECTVFSYGTHMLTSEACCNSAIFFVKRESGLALPHFLFLVSTDVRHFLPRSVGNIAGIVGGGSRRMHSSWRERRRGVHRP